MRRLDCSIMCSAYYNSSILLPDEIDTWEKAIKYAKDHLNEIPLTEMEYISDSDILDEENCVLVEREEELS